MAELTVPRLDFSPLAKLPEIYRDAQIKDARQRTLAELGQGGWDYNSAAQKLVSSGDLQGAMSLANIGKALRPDASATGVFGTPIYGQDDKGNTVLGAIGKNGTFQKIDTGGVTVTPGTRYLDTGTGFVPTNTKTGAVTGAPVVKDVAGAEREKVAGKSQGEAAASLPVEMSKVEQTTKDIDALLNHPGLPAIVGPLDQYRGSLMLGGEGRDALARFNQLKGRAFLQAFGMLKGGGSITEVEGTKAENAMARMNRSLNEDDFKAALKDFREAVSEGARKLKERASGPKRVGSKAEFDGLASGTRFVAPDGSIRVKP